MEPISTSADLGAKQLPAARAADALRLAVGTFTRIPVAATLRLDQPTFGRALALAPAVGVAIGFLSGVPLLLPGTEPTARLLCAVLTVGAAAWLTRGLHWDGLADLADGLGVRSSPSRALQVMRQSDIGPFGVMALMFAAAVQVLSLSLQPSGISGLGAWVFALAASRAAVAVGCVSGTRAARTDGLGAAVVGSVRSSHLILVAIQLGALIALLTVLGDAGSAMHFLLGLVAALAISLMIRRVAAQRLGGTTGDVLGATAEAATATVLLTLVLGQGLLVTS